MKETIPSSSITWSEMGKQNVQAEKVYCGIGHILGILPMNSYNTDIFFSNCYNLQSVHFEFHRKG